MCDICQQSPCNSRCPNAPEEQPLYYCDWCDKVIYEGDKIYKIDGEIICDDCIKSLSATAEREDE